MEPDAHEWMGSSELEEPIRCELGSLIAAASAWTEDEHELDDFVRGLVDSGRIALEVG